MQDLQKHQKVYTSFYPSMSKYEIYAETYAGSFVSVWKKTDAFLVDKLRQFSALF